MSVSLALLLTAGVLIACGVYLVLERTLSRIVLGFVLVGNGVNLLFIIAAGEPGNPPFEGSGDPEGMTDPLPFATVLTAIVISLAITAFGMALASRPAQISRCRPRPSGPRPPPSRRAAQRRHCRSACSHRRAAPRWARPSPAPRTSRRTPRRPPRATNRSRPAARAAAARGGAGKSPAAGSRARTSRPTDPARPTAHRTRRVVPPPPRGPGPPPRPTPRP